jgi:hypothetical protein
LTPNHQQENTDTDLDNEVMLDQNGKVPQLNIDDRYRLSAKEEKLHQKTMRTYFFMHAVVSSCFKTQLGLSFIGPTL